MTEGKVYLQDELNQKEPEKIINQLIFYRSIGKQETILAATCNKVSFMISNSLVVTQDRIVYINFAKKENFRYVSFLDFDKVIAEPDDGRFLLILQLKNGEKCDTGLHLSADDLNKLNAFINSYKEKGAQVAQNYLDQGITAHYLSHKESEDKLAESEKKKTEYEAKIQKEREELDQKYEAKLKELSEQKEANYKEILQIEKNYLEYATSEYSKLPYFEMKLTYCGGNLNQKPGHQHKLFFNHLKQAVGIFPPFSHQTVIPYANIKGAMLRRGDGIPRDQLILNS